MLRETMSKKELGKAPGFRWRGQGEISRIEGFSDAVLAFAVTLLVVSLEVPKTFGELAGTMRGFVAFAIGFTFLFQIWYFQFTFFRRYGLQDFATIVLNGILLFVVLLYVYPLKFLFTWLVNAYTGGGTMVRLPNGVMEPVVGPGQAAKLMLIYGLGFFAVYAVFGLLFLHAWRQREALELTPIELHDTRTSILAHVSSAIVGLVSIALVLSGGDRMAGWAGLSYVLLGPVHTVLGTVRGKGRRPLEAASPSVGS